MYCGSPQQITAGCLSWNSANSQQREDQNRPTQHGSAVKSHSQSNPSTTWRHNTMS